MSPRARRLRPALILAAFLAASGLRAQEPVAPPPGDDPPSPAGAPDQPFVESLPRDLAGVPGTWDLSRDTSTRRCVMTLSAESGPAGRKLTFPAGCRRALPILNGIEGWLFADGAVRLVDRNVRPVLAFARRPDARSLVARSEAGESFSLVPLQIAAMFPAPPPAPEAAAASPARADAPPASAPSFPGGDAPAPGLYALDRFREQDVCRIELLEAAAPAPVRVAEGCRDSGLAVFDPVSWRFADGRLTLNARRGHVVSLVPTGDGRWRRDPEVGTTFVLRRVVAGAP